MADQGPGSSVPIRPASSVMLVRDRSLGVEVFTLRRSLGMAFAAGMTAFPGGGSEPSDADPAVPWSGQDAAVLARGLGVSEEVARRQVVAAVRELFEETGVLLASGGGADAASLESDRCAIAAHDLSMTTFLRAHQLSIRADLVRPWARWITPAGPPRRYDTFFFAAKLPAGQQVTMVTGEASSVQWERPAEVLLAGERGEVGLMPPTVAMLTDLAAAPSVAALLATDRALHPVTPKLISNDGEVLRVSAGGREYSSRLRHTGRADAASHD